MIAEYCNTSASLPKYVRVKQTITTANNLLGENSPNRRPITHFMSTANRFMLPVLKPLWLTA